ncbi:hypothetical protein [Alkanindiges illinoisensis]|uniref:hypothetical protein n=1 Tax=Alkanindiges illinoisensis TaxID=197183 RepID=UPI000685F40E|nr:hypothetical protein [Alkanindiges illinoisensis]
MINTKTVIYGVLLSSVSILAHADNNVPQFKDYPAKVYNGKPAKLLLNNQTAKVFKTRLTEALKQKPVYAGEYVLASWGCGTECVFYTFVNKRTGQVLDKGFGGETGEDIKDFKLNSKLLITRKSDFDDNYNEVGSSTNYSVVNNDQFKVIKAVASE